MKCPATSALEALLLGQTTGEEFTSLCNHLSECSRCQAELDQLSGDAEMKPWRGQSSADITPILDNKMFRDALATAAQLGTNLDSQAENSTPRSVSHLNPTTLQFSPSEVAGDLGKIASYRIVKEIGRGGVAIVYEAIDTHLDRRVALKVLRTEQHESQSLDRFIREAKAIALVRHPNVVAIHSIASTAENIPFIAMELADGGCLQKCIQRGEIPPRQAAEWIAQVADGLAAVHQSGLIHRDIKPSNVLLLSAKSLKNDHVEGVNHEVAKLADFGLVRLVSSTNRETQTGMLLGTPAYMSPEHVTSFESVDARSDIYSLGATLYEALTGEPPFRGALAAVLKQIENDEPTAPRTLKFDIPVDLETICLKAMQRDRGKRYATAQEFAADLRRWLTGEPILARPVTAFEKFARFCHRNPGIAGLTGAVACLLLVLAFGSTYAAISINGTENKLRKEKENVEAANRTIRSTAEDLELQRQIALESLNSLVTKVQTELASRPGTLKLRESILQTALAGLERVTQNAGTLSSAHTTIEAHIRKGEIQDLLGKTADAIGEFRTAASLAEAASGDSNQSIDAQRDLGNALFMQAEVHRKAFAHDLAEPIYERVLSIRKAVAEKQLDDSTAQIAYITTMQRLADIRFYRSDWEAAQVAYDRVLETTQAAIAKFPDNKSLKRSHVIAYERLGTLATSINQLDKAQSHFDRVLELNQALLATDPENSQYRADLAYITKRLASLVSSRGDHKRAIQLAKEAIAKYIEIAESDPLDADAQMKVGSGWDTLYEVELAAGNLKEASRAVSNGLQVFEELASKFPTAGKYPSLAMEALLKVATAQLRLGEFAECIKSMNHYPECFEKYCKTADATPQIFTATLSWVSNTKLAVELAMKGLESINQQTEVPSDILYLAKTFAMYNFARTGDFENVQKVGELLKDYRANDPAIIVGGGLAVARAYAVSADKLGEQAIKIDTDDLLQVRDKNVSNCIAVLRSLAQVNPGIMDLLKTDSDFNTIRQHSDFLQISTIK